MGKQLLRELAVIWGRSLSMNKSVMINEIARQIAAVKSWRRWGTRWLGRLFRWRFSRKSWWGLKSLKRRKQWRIEQIRVREGLVELLMALIPGNNVIKLIKACRRSSETCRPSMSWRNQKACRYLKSDHLDSLVLAVKVGWSFLSHKLKPTSILHDSDLPCLTEARDPPRNRKSNKKPLHDQKQQIPFRRRYKTQAQVIENTAKLFTKISKIGRTSDSS